MKENKGKLRGQAPKAAEQAASGLLSSPGEIAGSGSPGNPWARVWAKTWAWALLLVIGVLWGSTFSLAKIVADGGGHPLGINYWQSLIGAGFLIALNIALGKKIPVRRAHIRFYIACGLLGSVIPGVLFFYAASRVSPGVLSITIATVPLMTFVAAAVIGIEKLKFGRVLGVVCGGIAIFLLVAPAESLPDPSAIPWVLVALFAAFCYTGENLVVALRLPAGMSAVSVAAGLFIAASVIMTPLVVATGSFMPLAWPWGQVEWALFGMASISVTAYSLFLYLITRTGPVFASQTAYVVTFSGVFWGLVIFDEQHSIWIWLSLGIMLAALALVTPNRAAVGPRR